jgi:hypothetical protein
MKTRNILFVLMIVLTASFIGCDKDNTVPNYTISGTVWSYNHGTDENPIYYPLEGVNICLEDTVNNTFVNSLTDVNGYYMCVVPEHWSGRITVAKVGGFVFKNDGRWYYTDVTFNHKDRDYWQLKPSAQ